MDKSVVEEMRQGASDTGLYYDPSVVRHQVQYLDLPEGWDTEQVVMIQGFKQMMTHIDESNMDAIWEDLSMDPDFFGEYNSEWAVRVVDDQGALTAAGQKLQEIMGALSNYPVLDDEDASRREYEETLENIESAAPSVSDDAPEDWSKQVFSWLWENNQRSLEGDNGVGSPSRADVSAALSALGWLEDEDDDEDEYEDEDLTEEEFQAQQRVQQEQSEWADPNQQKLQFDKGGRVVKGVTDGVAVRIAAALKKSQVFGGEAFTGDELDVDEYDAAQQERDKEYRKNLTEEGLAQAAEHYFGDYGRFVDHAEGGSGPEQGNWDYKATLTIPFPYAQEFFELASPDTEPTEDELDQFSSESYRGPGQSFSATGAYGLKKTTRGYTFTFSASGGLDV